MEGIGTSSQPSGHPPREPVIKVGQSLIFLNQSSPLFLFGSPPGNPVDQPRVEGVVKNSYAASNEINIGNKNFLSNDKISLTL